MTISYAAGEFNKSVTLVRGAASKDAGGAQKITYSDFSTDKDVYARVIFDHGSESVQLGAARVLGRATLTIRYRSDVDSKCGVRMDGEIWQFVSPPENIRKQNRYLEIQMELVKGTL